jgi:hypothetical protein
MRQMCFEVLRVLATKIIKQTKNGKFVGWHIANSIAVHRYITGITKTNFVKFLKNLKTCR